MMLKIRTKHILHLYVYITLWLGTKEVERGKSNEDLSGRRLKKKEPLMDDTSTKSFSLHRLIGSSSAMFVHTNACSKNEHIKKFDVILTVHRH